MYGIPFVWIPALKRGAAMLAAPDNLHYEPTPNGHRVLCPGAPPVCCNYSRVRRNAPLEAAEAIDNQEAPSQLGSLAAGRSQIPGQRRAQNALRWSRVYQVGLLCSVLILFRHVMRAVTLGRDTPFPQSSDYHAYGARRQPQDEGCARGADTQSQCWQRARCEDV